MSQYNAKPLWAIGYTEAEVSAIIKRRRKARALIDTREGFNPEEFEQHPADEELPSDNGVHSLSYEGEPPFEATPAERAAATLAQKLCQPGHTTKKNMRNWLLADLLAAGAQADVGPTGTSLDLSVQGKVFRIQVSIPRGL